MAELKLVVKGGGATPDNPKRPRMAGRSTGVSIFIEGRPPGSSRPTWLVPHAAPGSTTPIWTQQGIQGAEIIVYNIHPVEEFCFAVRAISFDGATRMEGHVDVCFAPFKPAESSS